MRTGFRMLIYSLIIVVANGVLSIRVNYFSDYCKGVKPYSIECINLLPTWIMIAFGCIVGLFFIMIAIEAFCPIRIDKDTDSAKSFIEKVGTAIINKDKTRYDLDATIHESAKKALEAGSIKDAKEILKLQK